MQATVCFYLRSVQYTWNRLSQGRKHSSTVCHGLIQNTLEKGEDPELLQYIVDIIVWGNTAEEVFEKREKTIQILQKANFAIKQSKVKGPVQEIQFLGVKWQDGHDQSPMVVVNKTATMSPPVSKEEAQAFPGAVGFWRMYIPDYSQIVRPLYHVTWKNNLKQDSEQQASEQNKTGSCSSPWASQHRTRCEKRAPHCSQGEWSFLKSLVRSTWGDSRTTPGVLE